MFPSLPPDLMIPNSNDWSKSATNRPAGTLAGKRIWQLRIADLASSPVKLNPKLVNTTERSLPLDITNVSTSFWHPEPSKVATSLSQEIPSALA
jgi:hypothetical protein